MYTLQCCIIVLLMVLYHKVMLSLTEEQGVGGIYRSTKTADQRAGGEGKSAAVKCDCDADILKAQYSPCCDVQLTLCFHLSVSFSLSILLFGLYPLVLTATGESTTSQQ